MKIPLTPLTGIAATPRKEPDKFTFNTVLDKVSLLFLLEFFVHWFLRGTQYSKLPIIGPLRTICIMALNEKTKNVFKLINPL